MFNKNSLRIALSGSVLVILLGSLSACSGDPTAPKTAPQHDTTTGTCTIVNGYVICSS
jgi:hypothetical protein